MNRDVAIGFLEDLHACSPDGEWLSAWAKDRSSVNGTHVLWSPVEDPEMLVNQLAQLPLSCCIFVGIATRATRLQQGRGGLSDCASVPALWVDIDVHGPQHQAQDLPPALSDAYGLLDEFPHPASMVIETGGGLQAYWLFEEAMAVGPEVQTLLERWGATWTALGASHGWRIDAVWDIPRVLRLPGTSNAKLHHQGVLLPVTVTRGMS